MKIVSSKLLILLAAIFLVVAPTLYFFKAVSTPPVITNSESQFDADMKDDINKIKDLKSLTQLDSLFDIFTIETTTWNVNLLIDSVQADNNIKKFFKTFIPRYISLYLDTLENKSWGIKDKNHMQRRLHQMRSVKLLENNRSVAENLSGLDKDFNKLESICESYNDAEKIVNHIKFTSIDNSRILINKVKAFSENKYLMNSDICDAISTYDDKMGNAHYGYIQELITRLRNWLSYSLSDTKSTFKHFNESYESYSSTSIYGINHPKSLGSMRSEANNYMQKAYDEKCILRLDGHSYDYTKTMSSNSISLNVETNHPDGFWISKSPSFCSITKKVSSIEVTPKSNYGNDNQGELTVKAGNKTVTVTLSQEPPRSSISIHSIVQE